MNHTPCQERLFSPVRLLSLPGFVTTRGSRLTITWRLSNRLAPVFPSHSASAGCSTRSGLSAPPRHTCREHMVLSSWSSGVLLMLFGAESYRLPPVHSRPLPLNQVFAPPRVSTDRSYEKNTQTQTDSFVPEKKKTEEPQLNGLSGMWSQIWLQVNRLDDRGQSLLGPNTFFKPYFFFNTFWTINLRETNLPPSCFFRWYNMSQSDTQFCKKNQNLTTRPRSDQVKVGHIGYQFDLRSRDKHFSTNCFFLSPLVQKLWTKIVIFSEIYAYRARSKIHLNWDN